MVNYKNSKIFMLTENDTGLVYIGGTTEKYLCKKVCDIRWKLLKKEHKTAKNCKMYEIFKNNNFDTTLLEVYPCNSKDELKARIFHHIREYKSNVEEV
jgi:hypothetical protein